MMGTMKYYLTRFFKKTCKFLVKCWNFIVEIYKNPKSAFGLTVILIFVFIAIFGPIMFPYDPTVNYDNKYLPPSIDHPFGTDWMGLDIFRQMISGTANVLLTSLYTALFSVSLGVILGILSGYVGGVVDKVIMFICNIFLSIPSFPVYLMLAALFTLNSPLMIAIVISIFSWAGLCRAIRIEIMSLKERDFIQICKVMHIPTYKIIFGELLPNVLSYVVVNFVLILRGAILASVGIMLVGLASYDSTNWGTIIQLARSMGLMNINNVIIMVYPLTAILLFQVATLLLSQGLDEIINPRLRRQ